VAPGSGKPTILFYGHYDVQPVDPVELWTSPPFEATVRDGEIYARGAADDKGQVFMHIKAVEAHIKQSGTLPLNIKFFIEGEEEVGSVHLDDFSAHKPNFRRRRVIPIRDVRRIRRFKACAGSYFQVDCAGRRAIHSGLHGAVANPAWCYKSLRRC
jgi:acetylornithine deacetylase/succinyl-diaminopimelate desuccinylase-like protein